METIVPWLVAAVLSVAGVVREAPRPETVTWEQLAAAPELFLGRPVQLYVQVSGVADAWEPFQTPYVRERWIALDGWADEQLLWIEEDHDAPMVRVFVDRRERIARTVARAAP